MRALSLFGGGFAVGERLRRFRLEWAYYGVSAPEVPSSRSGRSMLGLGGRAVAAIALRTAVSSAPAENSA